MKFLVATYGMRHVGMLLAHLRAIDRTHPDATVEVRCQDLPARLLESLKAAYPRVRFIPTAFDFANDRILRISSKTLAWEAAAKAQPDGELACFLDVDTLVAKPLAPFFASENFDVIFTFKDDGFVLNTGVLLCRMNGRTSAFFERWRSDTLAILRDPERFRQANDSRLPYGAADQMALHQLLRYETGKTDYAVEIGGHTVRFHGEPCEALNETRSCPITERTHIIHFKGGWQPILLDGKRFTRNRPREACWEMYQFYLGTFSDALQRLNQKAGSAWRPRDFGVQIPLYLNHEDGPFHNVLYVWHVASDCARDAVQLARAAFRLLLRKLQLCRN